MKRRILRLTLVTCFILAVTALFTVTASAATYGSLTYAVSNGKITITGCATSATSVTIPSTINGYPVTSIGDRAFSGCTSLTSISIPDSVTSIGSHAFYKCTSLASISIPDSVTSIGNYAFQECTRLTSVNIPDSVTSIGDRAFSGCSSLTSISIGNGVTSIRRGAFENCYGLKNITIPDSVTSIGEYAFSGCYELKNITIPNMVTNIGSYAFYNCTNLNYNIYKNACYLGNSSNPYLVLVKAISTSITSCTINTNARFIYSFAFSDCMSITSITIPNNVTSIGGWAFKCSGITSIAIPGSVTSIGGYAFYDCNELVTVYYCGTTAQWSNISISSFNYDLISATRSYHKYVYSLTEPTCTEDGIETELCEFCGEAKGQATLPALGHRVVCALVDAIKTENDKTYPFSLSDGVYSSTNKAHSSKSTFTITALYDCTLKLEYSVSSESNYDKLIISKNGTALYTKSGVVSWTAVEIELKAGDKLTISYSKDSSQSSNADTGYFKFSCDQVLGSVDIPADELEPTCKDAVICSYCNEVVKPIAPSNHTWGEWYSVVAHTCTSSGLERRVCSVCSKQENKVVPASHSWGDWYVTTPATCTSEGVEERICTNGCGLVETRAIAATGHSIGDWYVKTAPACTAEGVEEHKCTNGCGLAETRVIAATGHSIGDWYVKTAPACTAEGVEERKCTNNCGLAETRPIPATGHSYSDWNILVEPIPESEGFRSKVCSACGDEVFEMISYASGDVDGDGTLTNADLTLAVRAISGWNIEGNVALIDVNYDGKYNNRDIIAFIKKLAGID